MKKTVLCFLIMFTFGGWAQKNKSKVVSNKNNILATIDNISVQILTDKVQNRVVLFVKNLQKTDTLEVKKVDKTTFKPVDFTIKSFFVQGEKLYHMYWKEETKIETKFKKELIVVTENQLWNVEQKLQLLENTHKLMNTKETLFLDKNKTASQEVEKNRNEGFEFTLNADGTFVLRTKTQNNTYVYNKKTSAYEIKTSSKVVPSKKKK